MLAGNGKCYNQEQAAILLYWGLHHHQISHYPHRRATGPTNEIGGGRCDLLSFVAGQGQSLQMQMCCV